MSSTSTISSDVLIPAIAGDEILFDPASLEPLNTQPIDLVGNGFDAIPGVFPNRAIAGASITANFRIQNNGDFASGAFNVQFYLTRNPNSSSDSDFVYRIEPVRVASIAAKNQSSILTVDLILPEINAAFWSGDGTYYLGMLIDSSNQIAEGNERNNSRVGLQLDYDELIITNTQQANLRGKSLILRQQTLNAGDRFNLDFEIQNLGGASTGTYEVKFYLSKDRTIGNDDLLLVTTTLDALAANSQTGTLSFINDLTLPAVNNGFWTGDGTYFVGMVVDSSNAIAESNEADNSNQGLLIDFDDVRINNTRQPDLQGANFNVVSDSHRAGDVAKVEFAVRNSGAAVGAFEVSFYLSKDDRIEPGPDLFLGKITIDRLNLNETKAFSTDLLLPGINANFWTDNGTYHIGMVIDPSNTIAESNETNNRNQGLKLDYDTVTMNATTLFGTRGNDDFFGTASGDRFSGLRGDDDLYGLAGDDFLYGDRGDDNLYGGLGNDFLFGDPGDDWLWGVELDAVNPGLGEIDRLIGGFGADEFYLGSTTKVFYATGANLDYALIEDFETNEDTIVLNGSAGNYVLRSTSGSLPAGIGIYRNNDLISIVQGPTSLNLSAGYFAYFV
ncbi:MAG: CARDB domain-containing protein [Synechococcales bacterium]|nr:CARDB domain-containing protein [Synechococcales bacterium]